MRKHFVWRLNVSLSTDPRGKILGFKFSFYFLHSPSNVYDERRSKKKIKNIPRISRFILYIFSRRITRFREWFCRLRFSRRRNVMKSLCASDWFFPINSRSQTHDVWTNKQAKSGERRAKAGKVYENHSKRWQIISTRLRCSARSGKSPNITTIYHFRVDQLSEFIGKCEQRENEKILLEESTGEPRFVLSSWRFENLKNWKNINEIIELRSASFLIIV